ncbi:2-succinylbenzoate--CoA ligase [Streptomyces badius]
MGGRVRHAMSGGSGMDRRLGRFFAGAGVTVFEGYGLTESTAAATANPPERTRYGTVGQPIPGTSVHIADDGEVWVHGPNLFSGDLGNPEATRAVLRDGWLATGDLGSLDEDGYLTITGRKKEILVTSGGKSVSPAGLEERVRAHPLVAQCIVVGNDRPYIAALVTVDQESVDHWLSMQGRAPLSPAELVRDPDLEMEVRRVVVSANTAVSQAESILYVPDPGPPLHRGPGTADALADLDGQRPHITLIGETGNMSGELAPVRRGGPVPPTATSAASWCWRCTARRRAAGPGSSRARTTGRPRRCGGSPRCTRARPSSTWSTKTAGSGWTWRTPTRRTAPGSSSGRPTTSAPRSG